MRFVAFVAGLTAALWVTSTAEAARVTYTFSGTGSGELAGTVFTDKAFDIDLVGDPDKVFDPYFFGQIFVIDPLHSARVTIDGFGEADLTSPARLGINRAVNVIYFGPQFGPDYLDLAVTESDEQAFTFAAPYGPVGGTANTFGQFTGVGTDHGALSFTAVHDVTFAAASAAVPEPGAWALMILGFAGTGAILRRRRHALA